MAEISDTGALDSLHGDPADTDEDTGTTLEASPPPEAGPCAEIAANPPTVYVDKRSTRASKGTSDCPFATIREAVTFVAALPSTSGKHTIRVAGGTAGAPLVYDEPMLVLKPNTTLIGDGPGRVVIIGGGTCNMAVCMVVMEGNTALEGVTIDAKGGQKIPLAMGPGILTGASAKSITVTGTKDDKTPGIYVNGGGAAELGPDVKVIDNGGHGILVQTIYSLKLTGAPGSPNQINRNLYGVQLLAGRLEINGATEVSKNARHGVILVMNDKTTHVLDGLQAVDNGGTGLFVDGGAGLRLRHSKLVRNDLGLSFRFAIGNELDLGTGFSPGDNFIGGLTEKNKRAGICLPSSRVTNSPARGNGFSACPPTASPMPESEKACESLSGDYRDIYFGVGTISPTSGVPLELDGCTSK